MESQIDLIVMLVAGVLIVGPILAVVAFVRVSALRKSFVDVPKLIARIYSLEQRLDALERRPAPAVAPPQSPTAAPSTEHTSELAKTTPPVSVPAPVSPTPVYAGAAPPSQPAPLTPTQPHAAPSFTRTAPPVPAPETDFETIFAGRWMFYVGILALAVAVTFFLKYSFDNDWIGPTGRVALGLLAGSAMFPLSNWILNRGYRYFSEGIAGLGAAILYLSIWAGWHYYLLFAQNTAFALMIVVTAAILIVAIGRNSERIALLALVGGAITPILVSTGHNEEVSLFTYLAILTAGMLAVAWKRNWKSLPPVLFAATIIYFWGWYTAFYKDDELATTIIFSSLFFVLFGALPAIRSTRDGELALLEIALVLGNAFQYLIALRLMLWPEYRWGLTIGVLALAAAHLMAERALPPKKGTTTRVARILYAGLALTFVTVAIPIRLDGHWITIAFAAEGALLIWSGLRIASAPLRLAGFGMFVLVGIRLVYVTIPAEPVFLLNARFLTYCFCAAAFLAAFLFARRSTVELEAGETRAYYALSLAANFVFFFALSSEVWNLYGRMPSLGIDRDLAQQLALSVLWLCYAMALIVAGAMWKSASVRWQGLALLGVTVIKVFLFDLSFLTRFYRIISFFILGLVLLVVSFFYQRTVAARKAAKT